MVVVKDYDAYIAKRKSVAIVLGVAARVVRALYVIEGESLHRAGHLSTPKTLLARAPQSRGGRFHAQRKQPDTGGGPGTG